MKRSIGYITLFLFILSSCRMEHKVVEETYPDGTPKRVCIYKGRGENRELIHETTYYSNKQSQMDGSYVGNRRSGKWTYWYENGALWSEGYFINGKSDGKRTTYFENGKVRYEGNYKEDMRVGKWRFFDENGRLLKEVDYSAPPKENKPN
jgi:antitoxin component YwqK of YwqJK toxin-antitoxin module